MVLNRGYCTLCRRLRDLSSSNVALTTNMSPLRGSDVQFVRLSKEILFRPVLLMLSVMQQFAFSTKGRDRP